MFRNVFTILVFLFSMSAVAYGQSAQIGGQVQDASGAIVPKALVRVIDQQTSSERKTETNAAGQYAVPGLNPGIYKIIVQASGFSTAISNVISLNVAQVAVFDVKLQVGTTASEVVVNADNLNVNATDGSVSTVIDRQFVANLPLNGRSFQALLALTPGVAPNVAGANDDLSQGQFVVNGQRGDANYWMVDGVGGNVGLSQFQPGPGVTGALGGVNALGGTSALVSVDALQEFRFQTSTYAPEFGRGMGGQISLQSRSGTNKFHGALFDYLRNGDLDATDWFADHNGLRKPLEIQNDFGGVLGGPIITDKSFFFFSAEALRLHLPQTFLGTVPDLAIRQAAVPAMQPYINAFPLPDAGAGDGAGTPGLAPYNATYSDPGTADAYSLRIDHQLRENLNIFARYSHAPSSIYQHGSDGTVGNQILITRAVTKTATVGATWAQSANLVDDVRLNYSVAGGRSSYNMVSLDGAGAWPSDSPFTSGQGFTYKNSELVIYNNFGTNTGLWNGAQTSDFQHHLNIVDTLSWQKRSHNLKFGIDYRRLSPSIPIYDGTQAVNPNFDSVQDFAAGQSYFFYVDHVPPAKILFRNLSIFGQDTYRVTPRLNLTYGLRWDVDYSPKFEQGMPLPAITGYSTASLSNLALAPAGTPPYSTKFGNVAPRIGAAYRARTSPEWGLVVRSGFGVFYGLASTEIYNATYAQGFYPTTAYNQYSTYTTSAGVTLPYVPFPAPPDLLSLPVSQPPNIENGETLGGFDPNLNVPYGLEWNFSLEQSLGQAQSVTLSYVGAADKRLIASEYVNHPNPNYAAAFLVGNAGNSNYQALQAQFQRRLTNGLQGLVSYTWSHSIDTGSFGAYLNGTLGSINVNRGDSDNDVRHTFSGAMTYNVPAWKENMVVRALTSGWSTDNDVQVHSGPPVNIQDTAFNSLSTQSSTIVVRPDIVPGQPLYLKGSQYPGGKAVNPAAFTDPPKDPTTELPARQGTFPRNGVRGLGFAQWNFALRREFPVYERVRLQFVGELFNIFNHPNFGPFNNRLQDGNMYFGQATQMLNQYLGGIAGNGTQNPLYAPGSPRSGELALKLVF